VKIVILSALLNWNCWYNTHNIDNCLRYWMGNAKPCHHSCAIQHWCHHLTMCCSCLNPQSSFQFQASLPTWGSSQPGFLALEVFTSNIVVTCQHEDIFECKLPSRTGNILVITKLLLATYSCDTSLTSWGEVGNKSVTSQTNLWRTVYRSTSRAVSLLWNIDFTFAQLQTVFELLRMFLPLLLALCM